MHEFRKRVGEGCFTHAALAEHNCVLPALINGRDETPDLIGPTCE
jgi:hypothetical protein